MARRRSRASCGFALSFMLVPRYGQFAAPCLWVALELLRTYVLSGLPWSLLGYSQYRQLDVIQIADHLGVYGVSFLVVLTNVALAELYLWLMLFTNQASIRDVVLFPQLRPEK